MRFVDGERKVVDVGGPLTGALLEDGDGVLVGVHTLSGGNSKDHTCIDGRLVRVTDSGTRNLAEGQCGPVAIAVAGTRVYWLDDLYSAGLRSQTRLKSMELPR